MEYSNPLKYRAVGFNAIEGDQIIIDVVATEGGDSVAWLTDDAQNVLAVNDDSTLASGERSRNSQIQFTIPATGHYLVVLRDYSLESFKF